MKAKPARPVRLGKPLTEVMLGPRVRIALELGFETEVSVRVLNRAGRRALERKYAGRGQ